MLEAQGCLCELHPHHHLHLNACEIIHRTVNTTNSWSVFGRKVTLRPASTRLFIQGVNVLTVVQAAPC